MGVLLLVALIVGGGVLYDRAVLVPSADAKIKEIVGTKTTGSDDSRELIADGSGVSLRENSSVSRAKNLYGRF